MGVSGLDESLDSAKQRTQSWPEALRLRECLGCCSIHRKSRKNTSINNSERAERYGDVPLAVNEGNTPKGGHIQDIGFCLDGPSHHCGSMKSTSVGFTEWELGVPYSGRPMRGCEPHGRGGLATAHNRIPEKTVEVGSNNKDGRCWGSGILQPKSHMAFVVWFGTGRYARSRRRGDL